MLTKVIGYHMFTAVYFSISLAFEHSSFSLFSTLDLNNITENYCDQLLFPSPRVATGYTCVCGAGYNYSKEEGSCIKEGIVSLCSISGHLLKMTTH